MKKIEVEAYLHGMEAGEITELEYKDKVFVLKGQPTGVRKVKLNIQKPVPIATFLGEADGLDKGKKLGAIRNNAIYENILTDVKEAVNQNKTRLEIINEIREYYPKSKLNSLVTYYNVYLRFIKNPIFIKSPVLKYKKRKPKNALAFDTTYFTWILKEEYERIKKAINKGDFVATSNAIVKETGMKLGRVNATLHYMKKKNQVFIKKENKTPIYKPTF